MTIAGKGRLHWRAGYTPFAEEMFNAGLIPDMPERDPYAFPLLAKGLAQRDRPSEGIDVCKKRGKL
jgi:hypothetical protein